MIRWNDSKISGGSGPKTRDLSKINSYSTLDLPKSVTSFVIISITSAIVYRLFTVHVNLQFDFSAFLSLLLALFAIGLSALFYFKTTETSNAFYDNTHKFTREVSQILGRIEASFGERLKHLDEGYTGLRDKFENLPFDLSKARELEKEEKKEVEKKEAEYDALLNNLAERAQLAENEKNELFDNLKQTQKELAYAKNELKCLQFQIQDAEKPDGLYYLRNKLKRLINAYYGHIKINGIKEIEYIVDDMLLKIDNKMRNVMRELGLENDGELTDLGKDFVSGIIQETLARRSHKTN